MEREMGRLNILLLSAVLVSVAAMPARAQQVQLVDAFPGLSFTKPVLLTHSGDGTDRIFVVQQNGLIRVFANDSTTAASRTFLNLSAKISSSGGEEGLLGLAFHPQYESNGYFYVNYTAPGPLRTVVSRFSVSSDPDRADSLSEVKVLEINQPYTNHNGGMLAFGADGYLYIGTGDGGSGGDPQNYAQDRTSLLGKILRIDVDGTTPTTPYRIPADNPFVGGAFREEIWAYGLRNPWRFSFDGPTGELWAGDVGQGAREEIDIIQRGKNYGWRIMEGTICYNPSVGCDTTGLTLPVKDYGRDVGSSVTGGYVYRGARRPELVGAYVYADFVSGRIWKLRLSGATVTEDALLLQAPFLVSSFGVDQSNELYVCAYGYSGTSGIYRFNRSAVTDAGEPEPAPREFRLEQNYPNPFNPETVIRYQLPEGADVRLAVYDMLGREVALLAEGRMTPGDHQARFDGSALASGVYVYRLRAGNLMLTRSMLLLR
jgi:glucose/arabinose dehydrogenase